MTNYEKYRRALREYNRAKSEFEFANLNYHVAQRDMCDCWKELQQFASIMTDEEKAQAVNDQFSVDVEPELKGTVLGKVRLLMRDLDLGHKSAGQFFEALARVGLKIDHKAEK